jgi:glyceraldehyde-3-phosphate dehydrogenase/erythrose-4-phosphate dehydrogenase
MKVLIQGLGEIPATVIFAIEKEKPDITYILCSKYQMELVASPFGYTTKNEDVVEKAAKKTNTKVVFQKCNVFEPKSVGGAISEIIKHIKPGDDIVINYTGGAASVKLLLGASAVVLSRFLPIRIIYALKYKAGLEKYVDQTEELNEIFRNLYEFF